MAAPKNPGSREIRRAIDAGKIPPVWLWTGPEEYLKQELFDRLTAKLVGGDFGSMNVDRLKCGQDKNAVEGAVSTARTFPMLGERRVVLLEDVDRVSKKDLPGLLAYVRSPAPETALVLTGIESPNHPRYREIREAGAEQAVFWIPFENDTRRWIMLKFQDRGIACSPDAAEALMAACGGGGGRKVPIGDLAPELEKIALSLGERRHVTPEDVRVVARKAHEDLIWEVSSCMAVGDLPGALRALDGALLFKENPPHRILFGVAALFQEIARTRDFIDAGVKDAELQKVAGVWKTRWPGVHRGARGRSSEQVRQGLVTLAEAERSLKSTGRDPRIILEQVLASLC